MFHQENSLKEETTTTTRRALYHMKTIRARKLILLSGRNLQAYLTLIDAQPFSEFKGFEYLMAYSFSEI
jgi:hypothetical protein